MKNNPQIISAQPIAYQLHEPENFHVLIKLNMKNGASGFVVLSQNNNFEITKTDAQIVLELYQVEAMLEKYSYRLIDVQKFYSWENMVSFLEQLSSETKPPA